MHNLWAEDINHEIAEKSGSSVGRAEKQTASHPTERAILSSLRAWLLADYVAPYCRSLAATRIFRRCFLIDALGGTRKTGKDVGTRFIASTSLPIPPILQPVVSLAQELASENKPITLQG